MNCPRCKSDEICRSSRHGVWDNVRSSMGFWPYWCEACGNRFTAARRYPPTREAASEQTFAKDSAQQGETAGPEMAYRSDPVRPTAKVVIQADDHVQLDQILMALNRAVSYYQQPVREHAAAAGKR